MKSMLQVEWRVTSELDVEGFIARLDDAEQQPLQAVAALLVDNARSMVLPASRQTIGELSERERRSYLIRKNIAKKTGRPEPMLPYQHSRPGEPPLSPTGQYRRSIRGEVDREAKTAVAGPTGDSGATVPNKLEFGGGRIAPRPLMAPALQKSTAGMLSLFRDIL